MNFIPNKTILDLIAIKGIPVSQTHLVSYISMPWEWNSGAFNFFTYLKSVTLNICGKNFNYGQVLLTIKRLYNYLTCILH